MKNDLFDDAESTTGGVFLSLSLSRSLTHPFSLPIEDTSAHARRLATLASEIASFEAANVAPKDWALLGESTARARPKNSLLEETLDFERGGGVRGAPAVTEERTVGLEGLIKARILEVSQGGFPGAADADGVLALVDRADTTT